MPLAILGLGSNRGNRQAQLQAAAQALEPLLRPMRVSRVLESPALLPPGAPEGWNCSYLNMAVSGETDLLPQVLLAQIKAIEHELGRIPRGTWGPREIDIDILAICGNVLDSPELALPHRGLLKRDFALLPLADVAPEWRYPLPGPYFEQTAAQIAATKGFALSDRLRDTGMTIHV